jgi:hypothetical protein
MGTLKQIVIATSILVSGMIFTAASGHAGDFETCREVQSSNLRNFNMCLDRYNLPRVNQRQFRNIIGDYPDYSKRRYRADNQWYEPARPRYREREWRRYNKRRYIGDGEYSPNHDVGGLIITFGQFTIILK